MKTVLWISTILFFLLSWWWYVCPHKKVCPFATHGSANSELEIAPPLAKESEVELENKHPLLFRWASDAPVLGKNFQQYRDSLVSLLGTTDRLEILGGYFRAESNATGSTDLGLARAHQIRTLFPELNDDRFELKSAAFEREPETEKNRPFISAHFRKLIFNETVKEVAGKMIINFPHGSDEMISNEKLNQYLDDLVERLKSTTERVNLIGHTDSNASSARNERLGLQRANAIKDLLIAKGLAPERIITGSDGEKSPIASNETSAGRKQNRRVELTILP